MVTTVTFDDDAFAVHFHDGRVLRVPLSWFPALQDATPEQRTNVRISGTTLFDEA